MAASFHKSPLPAWIVRSGRIRLRRRGADHLGNGKPGARISNRSHRRGLGGVVVRADAAHFCRDDPEIASGDRYATLPSRIHGGALADSIGAAETMRQALIDADALAVDHRSREAESRLRHASRGFFTQRFRSTIDELTGTFQSAGEEIRVTTANLGARNQDMSRRAPRTRSRPPPAPAATSARSPTPRAGCWR